MSERLRRKLEREFTCNALGVLFTPYGLVVRGFATPKGPCKRHQTRFGQYPDAVRVGAGYLGVVDASYGCSIKYLFAHPAGGDISPAGPENLALAPPMSAPTVQPASRPGIASDATRPNRRSNHGKPQRRSNPYDRPQRRRASESPQERPSAPPRFSALEDRSDQSAKGREMVGSVGLVKSSCK